MDNWLDIYDRQYSGLLDLNSNGEKRGLRDNIYNRSRGYRLIFELLLQQKSTGFEIIETGTVRNPMNWKDGNSGFLFSELARAHGGKVQSVDVDQAAVDRANNFIGGEWYTSFCSDSVAWLAQQQNLDQIDLFYLDSYDVEWFNDGPSADHHLREFQTIEPFIKPGAVVAIDDNAYLLDGRRTGKGRAIVEYLADKNIVPLYDQYQIIYQFQ